MEAKVENERRWLVTRIDPDVFSAPSKLLEQGYMGLEPGSQRVRIIDNMDVLYTRKTGRGMSRLEKEYEESKDVPLARYLYDGCRYSLSKDRHYYDGWEADRFRDVLKGIVMVEFERADCHLITELPSWFEGIEVTDSVTNWHLAKLAHDLRTYRSEGKVRDMVLLQQRLPCMVLTGGPCSGKSKAMELLKAEFGDTVHFMPEMATMVITHGIKPPTTELEMWEFQRFLCAEQRIFEDMTNRLARSSGKRLVVVDRGSVDNAAYLPGGLDQFEGVCNSSIKDEYARYHSVLCLDTPPKEVYEAMSGNNPARTETYEQAMAVAERTKQVWKKHRGFRVIGSNASWDEKYGEIRSYIARHLAP